jgi:uncharacterized membrane protein YfcA
MQHLLWIVPVGVGAGAVTTISGAGGGLLLVLALSLVWDPLTALACSTPALLVSNFHRSLMYRTSVDWKRVRIFALGALPGAVVGALIAAAVPPHAIKLLLVVTTVLSVARAAARLDLKLPVGAVLPAGLVIGGLTGSSGGAGMLVAALWLSMGLVGDAYVGTMAVSGVAMQLGRLLGYGADGLFDRSRLAFAAMVAVSLVVGNLAGRQLRRLTRRLPESLLEHATFAALVLLALAGVA